MTHGGYFEQNRNPVDSSNTRCSEHLFLLKLAFLVPPWNCSDIHPNSRPKSRREHLRCKVCAPQRSPFSHTFLQAFCCFSQKDFVKKLLEREYKDKLVHQLCFQWFRNVPMNTPQFVAKNQHFRCLDIFSSGSWRVSVYTQMNHPWGV